MRQTLVLISCSALLLALVGLVGWRNLTAPEGAELRAKAAPPAAPAPGAIAADAGPAGAKASDASAGVASDAAATGDAAKVAAEPPKPPLDRPLRVCGLGWEVLAPGIIANQGLTAPADKKDNPFAQARVDVEFAVYGKMQEVEAALARGGADKKGADVAVVPLPTFVASYERLRALTPQIFYVVGWSRGREGLAAKDPKVLLSPPAKGELNLVGEFGEPATFTSLTMLSLAGIDLERVSVVPTSNTSDKHPFAAITRAQMSKARQSKSQKLLMTTADAMGLVPFVAIAPGGFVENNRDALEAWTRGWLRGVDALKSDVPSAARKLAKQDKAPEVVQLLELLGWMDFSGLAENAHLLGLSGRGALTIDTVFARTWKVWRDARALTTPSPAVAPVATDVVASLARSAPALIAGGPGKAKDERPGDPLVNVQVPGTKLDQDTVLEELGFLAGVFRRSHLRITLRGVNAKKTKEFVDTASDRFDIRPSRLSVGKARLGRSMAVVEVFAPL